MFVSQPTLSRHIIALEQELKVSLFSRANNTVRLTPIGQALHPKLLAMYRAFLTDAEALREMIRGFAGRLRIGVQEPQSIDPLLQNAIAKVKALHPEANITLQSVELKCSYARLLSGELDVLVALDATVPPSAQLEHLPLYQDVMCVAVPTTHPNATLTRVDTADIARLFCDLPLKLIDVEEFEPPLHATLHTLLDNRSIRANEMVRGEDASVSSFRLMSEAGLGLSFFNRTSTLSKSEQIRLIPLQNRTSTGFSPQWVTKELYWQSSNESPLLPQFLELVREALPEELVENDQSGS